MPGVISRPFLHFRVFPRLIRPPQSMIIRVLFQVIYFIFKVCFLQYSQFLQRKHIRLLFYPQLMNIFYQIKHLKEEKTRKKLNLNVLEQIPILSNGNVMAKQSQALNINKWLISSLTDNSELYLVLIISFNN